MDRHNVKVIRQALEVCLRELEETLELKVTVGSATFSPSNAVFKVEVAELNEDGEAKTREAEDFTLNCFRWALEPEDLGRTFENNGNTYKIIGGKPRSRKYPIICERLTDGARFKFAPSTVKFALTTC